MQIEIVESLIDYTQPRWNSWITNDYPFLQHEFLVGLESSGCTTADSGWQPFHITVGDEGDLVGFMPCYLKSHSYGEYVFDWSWADAWQSTSVSYDPTASLDLGHPEMAGDVDDALNQHGLAEHEAPAPAHGRGT